MKPSAAFVVALMTFAAVGGITRPNIIPGSGESSRPHGEHQFISAAATNWATQALAYAADRTP